MLCQFLLYNKVNQPYAYIYTHVPSLLSLPPTLPIPPLQVTAKHRANLPVLCSCFPLAVCFAFGSVNTVLTAISPLEQKPDHLLPKHIYTHTHAHTHTCTQLITSDRSTAPGHSLHHSSVFLKILSSYQNFVRIKLRRIVD